VNILTLNSRNLILALSIVFVLAFNVLPVILEGFKFEYLYFLIQSFIFWISLLLTIPKLIKIQKPNINWKVVILFIFLDFIFFQMFPLVNLNDQISENTVGRGVGIEIIRSVFFSWEIPLLIYFSVFNRKLLFSILLIISFAISNGVMSRAGLISLPLIYFMLPFFLREQKGNYFIILIVIIFSIFSIPILHVIRGGNFEDFYLVSSLDTYEYLKAILANTGPASNYTVLLGNQCLRALDLPFAWVGNFLPGNIFPNKYNYFAPIIFTENFMGIDSTIQIETVTAIGETHCYFGYFDTLVNIIFGFMIGIFFRIMLKTNIFSFLAISIFTIFQLPNAFRATLFTYFPMTIFVILVQSVLYRKMFNK
jgi:hypothetical protein